MSAPATGKPAEKEIWKAIPEPPEGYVWQPKSRFAQTHTPRYYIITEVASALEKSILSGNVEETTYWFLEYTSVGSDFVTSTWALAFQLASSSFQTPGLIPWMWSEYDKYKKCLTIPDVSDTDVDKQEQGKDDVTMENVTDQGIVDNRCLAIIAHVLVTLCKLPKSRLVESIVRAFFLPHPNNSHVYTYDALKSQVHLLHQKKTDKDISNTSYVSEFVAGQDNSYCLYKLQEGDPAYLARWCNALVQSIRSSWKSSEKMVIDDHDAQNDEYTHWSAICYFAGLIYQCTEPCQARARKQDSTQILWDIIHNYAGVDADSGLAYELIAIHKASDEISRNSQKREKYFFVAALTRLIKASIQGDASLEPFPIPAPLVGFKWSLDDKTLMPMPEMALDFTTKEGLKRGKTPADYLVETQNLIGGVQHVDMIEALFHSTAEFLDRLRSKEKFKETKRKLQSPIAFIRFQKQLADTSGKAKLLVNLQDLYTLPKNMYEEPVVDYSTFDLPWRGQFIPHSPNKEFTTSSPHPQSVLSQVTPIPGHSVQGLFYGVLFSTYPVFFICCNSVQQAFNACLADELKVIFGIPNMGTHCLYMQGGFERLNKKETWAMTNFKTVEEGGTYIVCYHAKEFKTTDYIPGNFENCTVDLLQEEVPMIGALGKRNLYMHPDCMPLRHQLCNVMIYDFVLGISGRAPHKILLRPFCGAPSFDRVSLFASLKEKEDNPELSRLANSTIVPFYEVSIFSNVSFPETYKALKARLTHYLLVDEQHYLMNRYLHLLMHLDWDMIESLFNHFGAPTFEWISVMRDNLRDFRLSWQAWTAESEEHVNKKKEKAATRKTTTTTTNNNFKRPKTAIVTKKVPLSLDGQDPNGEAAAEPLVKKKKLPPTTRIQIY